MWDPEGLESESEAHWKRQSNSSENGLAYQAYAGFRLAAAALNPFSGDSSMRDANRQFGAGINTAVDSINNAQIPELMKSVAKFGLGVGGSGHALNPISTTSGASEVVDAVKKHGAGTVLKQVGASIRNDALNNPEKLFGELLVGWASGVAVNSAVRIPFRHLGGSAANSADELITVRSYTNAAGREGISSSGAMRADSWVTLPGQIPARSGHLQVEKILEIQPGRGSHYLDFQVPASNLRVPANGPTTSGGAVQFQLNNPVPIDPSTFRRPPGRPAGGG
jgi:hypothetical protein